MCLNPKWIYKKGHYKEDNYRGKKGELYELGTYSKCGCCEQCINDKMNNWVVRNYWESKRHVRKSFITVTYEENPYILVKKDFQDFLKRLRIHLDRSSGEKVRFFEADEYGEISNRPHAHFILYGWNDKNAKYLGINKKKNIVYQSELVQNSWGLGRTSYQEFAENEIPYVALYETAQETFKRAYKLNMEKVKQIESLANNIRYKAQRSNLLAQLDEARKELENEKKDYLAVKERNSWSKALGWEEFYNEFIKYPTSYPWIEYIQDKEFVTPSSWIKKLANMGYEYAAKEMFKREEMMGEHLTLKEEIIKNYNQIGERKKQKIIEWNDKRTKLEVF